MLALDRRPAPAPAASNVISGPYASLLAASTDLGPAHTARVQLTVALRDHRRPDALTGWTAMQGLSLRWRSGDDWAIVDGAPTKIADAFGVAVHDYRGRRGQVFYASPQQPAIPEELRGQVAGLGRILGYTPQREARPSILPLDVPDQGLSPVALRETYGAGPLTTAGYTGKGVTVVIFAYDGFDQADLDSFATMSGLPTFTPVVVGGLPSARRGEATMDLEVIHALAPDAKTVLVNANSTVEGDGGYEKIAQMMDSVQRQFPGAVWSFSIGWGCEKLLTAADLAPVRSALAAAHENGTAAFDASGDLAGLDCKSGQDWSAPPGDADVGLDAVAALPEMTSVGGTTLSTDSSGGWGAEQVWFDPALTQGTGGGVSALFARPYWQDDLTPARGAGQRLTPDIAAVSDPLTGVKIVFNQHVVAGGGTSQAAPIWAGLAAVMNQYLIAHGGQPLGDLNPLLYRVAARSRLPAYHDVTLGGNAVDNAGPGYDLVTGLGTPDVNNLVQDLLVVQAALR
ncbi:MAG TPA: S53 family peptidase [Mycobacterium sp.]